MGPLNNLTLNKKTKGQLLYISMVALGFNAVMDLWLWSTSQFLIPCFTVSGFCVAFILILYVLKGFLDKE